MEPTLLFYAIGTGISLLGAGWGVVKGWTGINSRITTNRMTAETAALEAAAAKKRSEELSKELADIREANARDHGRLEAFNEGVIKALENSDRRLSEAVAEMTGSIRHLTERFDGFIAMAAGWNPNRQD